MHVVVASVPHTGTRFVFEHLLKGRHRCGEHPCDDGFSVYHTDGRHKKRLIALAGQFPTIVPMRHPAKVAQSWAVNRSKNPDYYAPDRLRAAFHSLVTDIDPLKPLYLPIDAPNRDEYLAKINAELGLGLDTGWPVVGESDKSATPEVANPDIVASLVDELSSFFGRFGYA